MFQRCISFTIILLSLCKVVCALPQSEVEYLVSDMGSSQWQYTYSVSNLTLGSPIEEFTIYFAPTLYENLAIQTPAPQGWSAIVWQPDAALGSGAYDVLALGSGINAGETIGSFSVSFNWLGTGTPGPQRYEILNPQDLSRIDSGSTSIPEPTTMALFGLGCLFLRQKQKLI